MVVSQPVQIVVTHSVSRSAVADATLDFAYADHSKSPSARRLSDDEYLDQYRYRRQKTDGTGNASLAVDIAWIAGGLFPDLDTERDRLTGESYLFRIRSATTTETVKVEVTPGATSVGDHFTVTVLSVGKPTPVSVDELRRLRSKGAPGQ